MAQEKAPRRRKVRRFTAPRRAAFLEFLGRTGNLTAAAAAVGIDRSTAEQRRKRDADFELGCREALAAADRALDEVKASIPRKLSALDRHDRVAKLAEGWSEDEETGRMIPPGWVRKEKDGSSEVDHGLQARSPPNP